MKFFKLDPETKLKAEYRVLSDKALDMSIVNLHISSKILGIDFFLFDHPAIDYNQRQLLLNEQGKLHKSLEAGRIMHAKVKKEMTAIEDKLTDLKNMSQPKHFFESKTISDAEMANSAFGKASHTAKRMGR